MDDRDEFPHEGPDSDEPIVDSWPVTSAENAKFGTVRRGEREDVGRSARIVDARVAGIVCAWERTVWLVASGQHGFALLCGAR